ncbi:biotin/lipoyl-containing protein [Streptomyces sp. MMG1121]|uniref:biotin/lipoyl-containing protein n=1 Tax=Streptomyces sp. MMG1121 TaxID=1415544 RepID=UPI00099C03CB|nr:lipoyl domain-containing protein [Streptomyces sp. MMG1121]
MSSAARRRVPRIIGESCLVATLALFPGVASPGAQAHSLAPANDQAQTLERGTLPPLEQGQSTNVVMPSLGESVTEATVGSWQKKVGDTVVAGESLGSVYTDKAEVEIEAPVSGVLREIVVGENETAKVGDTLAVIGPPEASSRSGE